MIFEPFAQAASMPGSKERDRIILALKGWLASPHLHPLVRILQGKRPVIEHPVYFKEEPRLILILEGTGRYLMVENDQQMIFDIVPGQALFLAPCTWSCPVPWMSYRSLAITFRQDFTRLTIHSRRAVRRDGKIPWRYLSEWQTGESLGLRGEHLLALLGDPVPPRVGETFFTTITRLLVEEVIGMVKAATELRRTSDAMLWHSVCDYISAHWSDPSLSRESTAQFFNRHPNHLSRFFHGHTKQNFRSYVNEIRLKRSLQFLGDLRYNVTDVASLCGFTDLQYFIRVFRKRFGLTPGEYRRRPVDVSAPLSQ